MDFQGWLQHIEQCSPHVMDFGLSRMQLMLDRMAIFRKQLGFVITVAGTNGKGSTVALLEACLMAAGLKVGVYTSPHLCSVTERIRVQLNNIDEGSLMVALQIIEDQRQDLPLTYFEFMTLAALWQFQQLQLDVVILEVGLGGRLDAVNVIDADLAIITSIALDHQAYLGDTLAQIASEKSGVMRADQPTVYGGDQVIEVIQQQALQIGVHLYARPVFSWAKNHTDAWDWRGVDANGLQLNWQGLPLPRILLDNAACCLQALQLLPTVLQPSRSHIEAGLASVHVLGRLQWLASSPAILVDVAHNPAAIVKVVEYLAGIDRSIFQRVVAVFGVMADKDWSAMVELLSPMVTAWVPVQSNDARALNSQVLVEYLHNKHCVVLAESMEMNHLVSGVNELARRDDLILVLGSFAIVGPFLQQFSEQ